MTIEFPYIIGNYSDLFTIAHPLAVFLTSIINMLMEVEFLLYLFYLILLCIFFFDEFAQIYLILFFKLFFLKKLKIK